MTTFLFFQDTSAKQHTELACSVAFSGAMALCILFSFISQFFYMKKTKTYKYLHTDLFFLFFVGFLFFGAAAITQLWDTTTRQENGTHWQYYAIRGSWIGSGVVVGLICSYFFLIKVMNRDEDMISQVALDSSSGLHSEGEEINETEGLEVAEESVDGDAEPTEEIFVSPELNI